MSPEQSYLKELNDAQQQPALHKDGPLMVIAGAGSGKTRVLTYRIAYLMQQGVDAFSILALTFTNKAAREMKTRIADLVGASEAKNLWMGTFHSVFARLLRAEADKLGFPNNFTIYDTQDADRLIASIVKEMGLDKDVYKYKQLRNRISAFKNSLINVNAYFKNPELQEADAMARRPKTGDIYREYVERCFKAGVMDFDDLLLKTNELLNRFPDVLAKYQDRFRYIMVDEYQDTNHSQYLIVRTLSDKFQNICVVGDDAQSIYGFRGANINNILNFQKDYADVAVYRLEQNYRSTKTIVNAANTIIAHNKSKIDKTVWTSNGQGERILVKRLATDAEEGRWVASSIFELKMQEQQRNKDFVILYRTNAQSRAMEDALRKRDIPYRVFGGLSFYQRKEIKDILAYLRILVNPKDEESLKRIINFPGRGIGQATIDKLIIGAKEHQKSLFEVIQACSSLPLGLNAGTQNKLQQFYTLIHSLQIENENANAFEIADKVIKRTGMINELKKDGTPEGVARTENIEELLNGIRDFTEGQLEIADATGSLTEFLEDVALATDFDNDKDEHADRVSLMTVHLAKGLEFTNVFIVGMEEDLFPSALSLNTRSELEEERRLFYVALTRAERRAFLSYAMTRYRWGKLIDAEPSRFIDEIDDNYLDKDIPKDDYVFKPFIDKNIFDSPPARQAPVRSIPLEKVRLNTSPTPAQLGRLKKINSSQANSPTANLIQLEPQMKVEHNRFGRGVVIAVDGKGNDKKATINFVGVGEKKLLLRFAKLKIIP
ncbi:MAG: UvrD-helicase domain-containing protein [Bacteroidetes bacterium]|nr:UvrD-helicase domain-containing protein [Bacteroidota bacterium]MDA0937716.1 UvrD-helicase domain-containing protein [Bacteroidota bacterium]MDA1344318.1 UvrD-helicase domain-containing protein [Bacteroidota bacterium]